MDVALNNLARDLAEPIREGQFAGEDIRLDDRFETLQRQIKAADSLVEGVAPDWSQIARVALGILREESKDLLVLAYLCLALAHTHRVAGLVAGLGATAGLLEQFGEQLFPKRPRARQTALDWMMERLVVWADVSTFEPSERAALDQALVALERVGQYCQRTFPEGSPDTASLRRILKEQNERLAAAAVPELTSQPVAEAVSEDEPSAASGVQPAVSARSEREMKDLTDQEGAKSQGAFGFELSVDPVDDRQVRDALRQLQQANRTLTEAMLRLDISDPRPFDIHRAMTWASVQVLPQAEQGKTALRAPPLERRQLFQSLFEQGQYAPMIIEVERSFAGAPFWLDAHYWVWRALGELKATAAQTSVLRHLAGFLERFPELLEYRFADDTPFASSETRAWWLEQRAESGHPRESSSAGRAEGWREPLSTTPLAPNSPRERQMADVTPADDAAQAVLAQAHQLARQEKLPQALQVLQDYSQETGREAQRFLRQLQLAEFCLQYRQEALARAWLEALYQRLQELSLWEWEPDLCRRVLERLVEVESSQPSDSGRWQAYFDRLCVLDTATALCVRKGEARASSRV